MNDVVATPDAIRRYGDSAASMAQQVATAGAVNQGATMAAMAPAFGLIGQEYLLAYAHAQANHLASVAELATVHAMTAVTSYQAAGAYEATDEDSAGTFRALGLSAGTARP